MRPSPTAASSLATVAAVAAIAGTLVLNSCARGRPPSLHATEQRSGTKARLQAVHAVDERVVWASGLEGTWVRTRDGGSAWVAGRVPGAEEMQFRDVHAFDAERAFLLAAGPGEASRIYETADGGASWSLRFVNREPQGFLDCFDFWSRREGLVYGDSIDGRLVVLATRDGGASWQPMAPERLPPANPGEGGFAASGTCVTVGAGGEVWIATGAGGSGRVLRSVDRGVSWSWAEAPTVRGEAAGLTSVAFRDASTGIAVGGDLERRDEQTENVAWSRDGGATWRRGGKLSFVGPAYGSAWAPGERSLAVAVGPGGLAYSLDLGRSWIAGSEEDFWAVDFGDADSFWAVGPQGRVVRFEVVAGRP